MAAAGAFPAAYFKIFGNFLSAVLTIQKGAKVIRRMLMLVILLLFLKVLYDFFV